MILLCPPEKSTQFHYPLDPKKIRAEGSMHKDTTYQGSDRQDFYRHGKKIIIKKRKQTNKTQTSTGFAHRQPSKKQRNQRRPRLVCHRQPSKNLRSPWCDRNFGQNVNGTLRSGWKLTFYEKCSSIFPLLVPEVSYLLVRHNGKHP